MEVWRFWVPIIMILFVFAIIIYRMKFDQSPEFVISRYIEKLAPKANGFISNVNYSFVFFDWDDMNLYTGDFFFIQSLQYVSAGLQKTVKNIKYEFSSIKSVAIKSDGAEIWSIDKDSDELMVQTVMSARRGLGGLFESAPGQLEALKKSMRLQAVITIQEKKQEYHTITFFDLEPQLGYRKSVRDELDESIKDLEFFMSQILKALWKSRIRKDPSRSIIIY